MKSSQIIKSLIFFLYSLAISAKLVVISDIDDTIKKANSVGKVAGAYHFLKKKPYLEMRDLFQEINHHYSSSNDGAKFYYVSAAPDFIFNAEKWLYKYEFPYGESYLKHGKESTYDFKYRTIKKILIQELKTDANLEVMMFGDNAQVDQVVYNDLKRDLNLNANIYIRDVKTEATYFASDLSVSRLPNTFYYFSEIELVKEFNFLSSELLSLVHDKYAERKLIPKYTLHTLKDRLESACKKIDLHCQKLAHQKAYAYWNDYYTRF